jgi:short-subunit dehydrogenase
MEIRAGDVALVTGASRGIGAHVALALARRGMDLVLAARSQAGLDEVADRVRGATGVTVTTLAVDLADRAEAAALVGRAEAEAGRVDVLVNNAGIEYMGRPDEAAFDDLVTITDVNLLAPMVLTRNVLPGMVSRGRGHVVNVASVAGLLASAYAEPYNATKFAVVGYTRALRLTAQDLGWPVSASAVCPGFVSGEGMFADVQNQYGVTAPKIAGALPAELTGEAVVRAVEKDLPEVIVMRGPARAFVATSHLAPRAWERLFKRINLAAPFRDIVTARRAGGGREA